METGRVDTDSVLRYASQIAYSTKSTLQFTYDMGVKFRDVEGCYVECGVAAGSQIIALLKSAPDKTVFAFDSFQGIPLPSNKDDQYPGIRKFNYGEVETMPDPGMQVLQSSGATVVSIESFMEHIERSGVNHDNLIIIKGWFEETLPNKIAMPIAILRLDGDLYHSTYIGLKYLFPFLAY